MSSMSPADAATPQGAERRAILDAARAPAAAQLGKPVQFKVERLERSGDWVFLRAAMQDGGGRPVRFDGTPLAEAASQGFVSDQFAALLHREGGRWTVKAHAVGPTDVAWEDWDETYGAPPALFRP